MGRNIEDFEAFVSAVRAGPPVDAGARAAAMARDAVLTKPAGALGRLEEIVLWLAGWQRRAVPAADRTQVIVFAGNHGVAARGVSAFPADVTAQMVANFEAGGAAVNQLARLAGARLEVVALELERPTADFTVAPAMTPADCLDAIRIGWEAADPGADLLIVGEMGIGNTTSAAALGHALLGGSARDWVGRGTGLDDDGLARKAEVVQAGVARHHGPPLALLAALGGREIAAMVGAMGRARAEGVPVLLDGFIATAAAAVLGQAVPGGLDHVMAAHRSDEAGHGRFLAALGLTPLLDLGMRLGEGSGAAVALQVVRAACACHGGMATFAEAGVSDGGKG